MIIRGIPVCPGLISGRVYIADLALDEVRQWTVLPEGVEEEIDKLHRAREQSVAQLKMTRDRVCKEIGEEDARIFDFHRDMILDPAALKQMTEWIREERLTAEAALVRFTDLSVQRFRRLDPGDVKSIGLDIRDSFQRVRNCLLQIEREEMSAGPEGVVLVAEDLTPSLTMMFPREKVHAIVTESGGKFSHGAVLVRSMGIPTVIGVSGIAKNLSSGDQILVNGTDGTVELMPGGERTAEFLEDKRSHDELQVTQQRYASKVAQTLDGERVRIDVNVESVKILSTFDVSWCDGIGLCRTEFLYRERTEFPSEEEQLQIYRTVLETMQDRPVVFRTLDIGNDKQLPYFGIPDEDNPALGWRGLRISLQWRDLFLVQLRALLRASAYGKARILLPMVTTPEEVFETRDIVTSLKDDLRQEGTPFDEAVPLGVMIEVPAAIYGLPIYAEAVDFLTIGTNDLVQYLLAVDRDNKRVASIYDPYHPVVLRAIDDILQLATKYEIPVSVCGEMAGMVDSALVLLALGVRALSMSPQFVPDVKLIVSQVGKKDLEDLREAILTKTSAEEVRVFLEALVEGVRIAASQQVDSESPV